MNLVKRNPSVASYEAAKASLHQDAVHSHSTYSIYKRLANLALAIFTSVICLNLWLLSTDKAANWHAQQASQLGRSLISLAAKSLAPALETTNREDIAIQIAHILEDVHVLSATVHDAKGNVVFTSRQAHSLLSHVNADKLYPLVFVEEIKATSLPDENVTNNSLPKTIGYLRLLLDEKQVMRYHDEYQQQLFEQMLVLMVLAGAFGLLLARAFYKFRYRNYRKLSDLTESENTNAGQTAQQSLKL